METRTYKELEIERDKILKELGKEFTPKQFELLNELIGYEIELEKFCNQ